MDSSDPHAVDSVQVDRGTLTQLVIKLLQRKGMFAAEAEKVADRMIEADLAKSPGSGVGSLPEYLEAMDLGDIDPRARLITVTETPGTAVVDGSTGMGHVATTRAMQMAMEKANAVGTGLVVIRNSRPCGDLGIIARLATSQGLIGLVMSSFGDSTDQTLAWSPSTGPIEHEGTSLTQLSQILSAGLAGADPLPRKRKSHRAANVAEYALMAISPSAFGAKETLAAKWGMSAEITGSDATLITLSASDAKMLAELAAKIKFAINW